MIKRIVKLTFEEDKVGPFVEFFHQIKGQIRNYEGCLYMELLKDITQANVYFTISYWDNQASLDNYRASDLFTSIWPKTKQHFSAKPEAWSLELVDTPNQTNL